MEIGRAVEEDYQGILELQSKYYVKNLGSAERKEGFLSAEFNLSQIAAMAEDIGIAVARDAGRLVGYMCASRADLTPRPPVVEAMLERLEGAVLHGKRLAGSTMFIYGPVCIDKLYRGRGLLRRLFDLLKTPLAGMFEVGVAFVAADNHRSLSAHVFGLGMEKVGRFEHAGNEYHSVAFVVK
jgi:L-amino acid N-acyltransferase YncA